MTIRAKPAKNSRALLLIPVPLVLLFAFYAPHILTAPTPAKARTEPEPGEPPKAAHPRGIISPLLHAQHLSHAAFHNPCTKLYLADLVSEHHASAKSGVIIGFAYGGEARRLAKYNIHAIEPMPHFIENFGRRNMPHVTLHPFAAANEEGLLNVTYNGVTVTVNKTRGEGLLPRGFAPTVVSADTQGSEYGALLGLGEVMDRAGSVWVELGCRDSTEEMLRWLDERFVLFDFVPWGKRHGVDGAFEKEQFAIGQRPDGIPEWVSWFCERRKEFMWLQTDIVGVKRDIVDGVWNGLEMVGSKCCSEHCNLKQIIESEASSG